MIFAKMIGFKFIDRGKVLFVYLLEIVLKGIMSQGSVVTVFRVMWDG